MTYNNPEVNAGDQIKVKLFSRGNEAMEDGAIVLEIDGVQYASMQDDKVNEEDEAYGRAMYKLSEIQYRNLNEGEVFE